MRYQLVYATDNMFEAGHDALVNPINAYAVSGKGLAKEFKRRYPVHQEMLEDVVLSGVPFGAGEIITTEHDGLIIHHAATKLRWWNASKYEDIESIAKGLGKLIDQYDYQSLGVPALGCGLGGLDWTKVSVILYKGIEQAQRNDLVVSMYPPR